MPPSPFIITLFHSLSPFSLLRLLSSPSPWSSASEVSERLALLWPYGTCTQALMLPGDSSPLPIPSTSLSLSPLLHLSPPPLPTPSSSASLTPQEADKKVMLSLISRWLRENTTAGRSCWCTRYANRRRRRESRAARAREGALLGG